MSEDGYKLWLRYAPLGQLAEPYKNVVRQIVVESSSATGKIIRDELTRALPSLLGTQIVAADSVGDGAVVVGTPDSSAAIKSLGWDGDLKSAGPEGFVIRSATINQHPATVIASSTEVGALYGTFHFLRMLQTGMPIDRLAVSERPKVKLRLLNHWDNLNGAIERGYAGRSLWQWAELPDKISPRYADYARANASIGINGAVLNNVNTDPRILSPEYLRKIAALASVFRPYGIKVYLSVNFASPRQIGGLATNDPSDQAVKAWWKSKVEEIYALISDFGGFLVKANSEGQPGPQDYQKTHADGANMMAEALAPHGGIVMWRAFVYNPEVDPDRIKRAYIEFTALDGKFLPNAAAQVKNGPLDFMPREPFHALFGAMKQSPVIAEVQAAQEYLGQSRHLVYLGTMWKEFLDSDTFAKGPGTTVGKVLDGSVYPYQTTGMVAVSNTGSDTNWCGHEFSQANWYAFGRLAWNHEDPAEHIAEEWIKMTFTLDPKTIDVIKQMMLTSREIFVDYTMPLGLHHLIGGDHYAPMPWVNRAQREDWTAYYYHRAAKDGIGFDRTSKGNNAIAQYFPPVRDTFESLDSCPDKFLLWFHRLPWDYKMRSGKTLWQELVDKYHTGAAQAAALETTWKSLEGKIDDGQFQRVADRMKVSTADSAKWRDQCLNYFQTSSGMPIEPSK